MMDSAEVSPVCCDAWTVARHGRGGSLSEEGGNGAPMAKLDGFFILQGRRD
jgi:hypothetical protein